MMSASTIARSAPPPSLSSAKFPSFGAVGVGVLGFIAEGGAEPAPGAPAASPADSPLVGPPKPLLAPPGRSLSNVPGTVGLPSEHTTFASPHLGLLVSVLQPAAAAKSARKTRSLVARMRELLADRTDQPLEQ